MTDEETKNQFRGLANLVTLTFILLILFVCIVGALIMRQTHDLICSAENPPKACRE